MKYINNMDFKDINGCINGINIINNNMYCNIFNNKYNDNRQYNMNDLNEQCINIDHQKMKNEQSIDVKPYEPSILDTSTLPNHISFELFPDEILMLIFSNIKNMETLSNLRQCCKRINSLIEYNFADINKILDHGIETDTPFFIDIAYNRGYKFTNKDALGCVVNDCVKCLEYMCNNGCEIYDIIWIYIGKHGSVKCYYYLKQIGKKDPCDWARKNDVTGKIKLCQ